MITIESTRTEITDFIRKNYNRILAEEPKMLANWHKLVRNSNGKTSILYPYNLEGVNLYYYRSGNRKTYFHEHIIEIPFAKDKCQYVEYPNNMVATWKYTHHFFERYRERLKLKCTQKQMIKHFLNHTNPMICIYRKNNQLVFATEQGLVLGVDDEKLEMNIGCTFVDYGLLKVSQKAAFNKVQQIAEEVISKHQEMSKSGIAHYVCSSILEEKYKNVCDEAKEIYSMYYEMGDLRERKY